MNSRHSKPCYMGILILHPTGVEREGGRDAEGGNTMNEFLTVTDHSCIPT